MPKSNTAVRSPIKKPRKSQWYILRKNTTQLFKYAQYLEWLGFQAYQTLFFFEKDCGHIICRIYLCFGEYFVQTIKLVTSHCRYKIFHWLILAQIHIGKHSIEIIHPKNLTVTLPDYPPC